MRCGAGVGKWDQPRDLEEWERAEEEENGGGGTCSSIVDWPFTAWIA